MENAPICTNCQSPIERKKSGPRPKLCLNCRLIRNKIFYADNREREKARAKACRLANPDQHKATTAAWRAANKERHAEMQRAWQAANVERRKAYRKANYAAKREQELAKAREYKLANKETLAAKDKARREAKPETNRYYRSLRRASEKRATPPWADKKKIRAVYAEAARITAETGKPHHVDHIYPLQSDWICGLHVHWNLQVLAAPENQSKSNRRLPEVHG